MIFQYTTVPLLDQNFRVTLSLNQYDKENYLFRGFKITFNHTSDSNYMIRGKKVSHFQIDYIWWPDLSAWIIHDDASKFRLRDGSTKRLKVHGWFKPYFAEFISRYPNWKTEFPKWAIEYEITTRIESIDDEIHRLNTAKSYLEGFSSEVRLHHAERFFSIFDSSKGQRV